MSHRMTHTDSLNDSPERDVNQLTVRGYDDELSAAIHGLAKREGISLNRAALRLLRKGAGITGGERSPNAIGSSLDDLFGAWTRAEAESLDSALEVFETVDESAWT